MSPRKTASLGLCLLLFGLSAGPGAWHALAAQRAGRSKPAQVPRPRSRRLGGGTLPPGLPALGRAEGHSIQSLPTPAANALEPPAFPIPPSSEPLPAPAQLDAPARAKRGPGQPVLEKLAGARALHGMASPGQPGQEEGASPLFDGAQARGESQASEDPGNPAASESPASGSSAASLPSSSGLWQALQAWTAQALGLSLEEDLSQRWGKLVIETLRGQPALPLEAALAESLSLVHHLDSADAQRARDFFSGSPIQVNSRVNVQLSRVGGELYAAATNQGLSRLGSKGWRRVLRGGHVYQIAEALGRAWAATDKGLFVLENGRWRPEPVGKARSVTQVLAVNGEIYAATNDGLYIRENQDWRRVPIHDVKGVYHLAVDSAGDLYAVVDLHKLYYRRHGREDWDYAPIGGGSVRGVQTLRGQAYALTDDGAFARYDGDKWGDDFNIPGNPKVNELLELEGELYARTAFGLYLREAGGRWQLVILASERERPLQRVTRIAGRFYYSQRVHVPAQARVVQRVQRGIIYYSKSVPGPQRDLYSHELYVREGDSSRLLIDDVGWVYQIMEHEGEIFIASNRGLWRIAQSPPGLGPDWRERVLEAVNAAAGPEAGAAGSGPPFRLDPQRGSIEDEEGRTIFSGLYRLGVLALAALLSPLAQGWEALMQWTGSLGLSFPLPAGEPPLRDQLEALMDKYEVPAADRPLRRKLTLEAVTRIQADIPLFADNPELSVRFGPWWLTAQDLSNPDLKEILIPLEDIFLRAVDPQGVKEAVGAARHEVAHYLITRPDPGHPLTGKYLLSTSPPANNLLHQAIEDTRVNTWTLLQEPGASPYFDALYDADWPENPENAEALKRARMDVLARSTLSVESPGRTASRWMPPHLQYLNAIVYHWRHGKAPPFLQDPLAARAFEATKDSLERLRRIHPQPIGDALIEPMKAKAFRESLEATDREIFPRYQELVEESRRNLKAMASQGAVATPLAGRGSAAPPREGDPEGVLALLEADLARHWAKHGRQGKDRAPAGARGNTAPSPSSSGQELPGEDRESGSWLRRRERALAREKAPPDSLTTYERYKLRALELGLISKVDGIIKKILLPTKHARLSPQTFHEGDEPDMDKYYDDLASGRLDTPIMRRWNRKVRRSAKISLVLDVSGSMGGLTKAMTSPLDYALLGIVAWVEVCQKNGLDFEVTLFDTAQHVAHPFGKRVDRQAKEHIVREILERQGGATAIGAAFEKALQSLIRQSATHRFLVFATDEEHNTGEPPGAYQALAKKNRVVSIALVIGAKVSGAKKHFDFAVRVKEAKDFPRDLLGVLKLAIRSVLGLRGAFAALSAWGLHSAQDWLAALGSLGLAFPAVAKPSPDPWAQIEERLWKAVGRPPEEVKTADWRQAAADRLRSQPDLPFKTALVETFAQAHRLSPEEQERASRSLLGYEAVALPGGPVAVSHVVRHKGATYATTRRGVYALTPRGWDLSLSGSVKHLEEFQGSLYALSENGRVYRLRPDGWHQELRAGGGRHLLALGQKLYAVTGSGLYERGARAWHDRHCPLRTKGLLFIKAIGRKLYAGTQDGLYWSQSLQGPWSPLLVNVGGVHDLQLGEGKLLAATDLGLYRGRGQWSRWTSVPEGAGAIRSIAGIGRTSYLGAEGGLYAHENDSWRHLLPGLGPVLHIDPEYLGTATGLWRWQPQEDPVPPELEKALLEDIGRRIEARWLRAGSLDAEPFTLEEGARNLLDQDGRAVFSF